MSPKKIIVALRAKSSTRLGRSNMPDSIAITTIMTDELSAYSYQRR